MLRDTPPDRVAGDQQQFVNVRRRGFEGFRPVTIGDAHGCTQVFGFFRIAGKRHDLRRVSLGFELMDDQTAELAVAPVIVMIVMGTPFGLSGK